ncbi:MAG: hypothetical protein M3Q48_08755 [Actinomycetota bacterium]|nr:hypothetical protein [Actinomycetota bacterium]
MAPERLTALPEATECVACKNGGLRLRSARALGERRRVATI